MHITKKISAALAIATISAAFTGYSTSADAAGSLRESCTRNSRSAVASCCNAWVRSHGKPIWMTDRGSCSTAAVCSTSPLPARTSGALAKKPQCYIQPNQPEGKSSYNPPPGKGR